jgi:fatty-acyl-CoA synthase
MSTPLTSPDWIAHHARTAPTSLASVDLSSDRTFTYGEFNARISALAGALVSRLGCSPKDRIVVLSRNDSDVFEIQFACQRADLIFVPLNWRLTVNELRVIVNDARPTVIFYSPEFRAAAEQLASSSGIARAMEMRSGQPSDYERCIAAGGPDIAGRPRQDQDVWALLYTSGTTGRPKGAQITYGMALCNAVVLGSAFGITSESKNLVVLPTFHTGGLNVFANPVFFHGGTNYVLREFDPGRAVDSLGRAGPGITHMLAVPTVHAMLMAEPGFGDGWSDRLHGVSVAGAPCPASIIERYAEHGLSLRQCWGMTEAGPHALIMPRRASAEKRASSGVPTIFGETMVADREGNALPDGEIGELLVKGPLVTPGYWNRPEVNCEAFTPAGWFRTGDAACRDPDGYYFIVDRWKDMFISGGENVYPAEIERALVLLADVAECAVVSMSDDKWGEVGSAFIVRRADSRIGVEALVAHCEKHLARYKIPKRFTFVDELPRNASGKILKAKLRERA